MSIFDFFTKRNTKKENVPHNQEHLDESYFKVLSIKALEIIKSEIETMDYFLPFGGLITLENEFEMIVYQDPEKNIVDQREHATIIQKIIQKKYRDPKNNLFFMAWDGVAHLDSGDIDCISIKVDNKFLNQHKIFMYTYKKENNKVEILNLDNPIVKVL